MSRFDPQRADERASAAVDDHLAGTGLTWALVMWLPGSAEKPSAIAINSPPAARDEVRQALATALAILPQERAS